MIRVKCNRSKKKKITIKLQQIIDTKLHYSIFPACRAHTNEMTGQEPSFLRHSWICWWLLRIKVLKILKRRGRHISFLFLEASTHYLHENSANQQVEIWIEHLINMSDPYLYLVKYFGSVCQRSTIYTHNIWRMKSFLITRK